MRYFAPTTCPRYPPGVGVRAVPPEVQPRRPPTKQARSQSLAICLLGRGARRCSRRPRGMRRGAGRQSGRRRRRLVQRVAPRHERVRGDRGVVAEEGLQLVLHMLPCNCGVHVGPQCGQVGMIGRPRRRPSRSLSTTTGCGWGPGQGAGAKHALDERRQARNR